MTWGITREIRDLFETDIRGSLPSLEERWTWLSLGSWKLSSGAISKEVLWKSTKWLDTLTWKASTKEAQARLVNNKGTTTSRILPFKANPQGKCLTLQKNLQLYPRQLHTIAAQLLRNPWAKTCRRITNSSTRCAHWATSSIPAVPQPREQVTKGHTEIYPPRETSGHGSTPA